MRPLLHRVMASLVKAAAALATAAFVVVGGAVVPANAVVQYTISGHVDLGSLGNSAGSNTVWVYFASPGATASDFISARSTSTDASGNYTIVAVPEGSYSLWFRYVGNEQGYASKYWDNADTPAAATYFTLSANVTGKNAILPAYPTLSGVVSFGTQGNHPDGVTARVTWERQTTWYWEAGPSAGVVTDANGAFSFPVAPGVYRVRVGSFSPDYESAYVLRPGSQNQADPTYITMGTSALTGQDVVLPKLASISGHVYLGSSAVSAGAGDVRVFWVDCANTYCNPSLPETYSVLTDADGNYVIPRRPNGSVTLRFTYLPSTAFQPLNPGTYVTVANYADVVAPGVTMLPSASISGRVSLGTGSTPAGTGDVTVSASRQSGPSSWTVVATTTTDASGDYSISGLEARSYRLSFHHNTPGTYPDLWWLNAQHASQATSIVATSTALTGYDVTMPIGASFTGVLKNSSGAALVGFTVKAYRYAADSSTVLDTYTAVTGSDGSFVITGAPAGRYLADVYKSSMASTYPRQWIGAVGSAARLDLSKAISMSAGEVHAFGDITAMSLGKVTGAITCGGCGFGMYSKLYVSDPSTGWVDVGPSEWSGSTIFMSLLPGTYQLRAGFVQDSPYVAFTSEEFTLVEGQQMVRDIALVAGPLQVGRLVKSNAGGATPVYLVDGLSRLVPVPSVSAATDAGVPAAVIAVSPASLAGYSIAPAMSNVLDCYGYLTYFASKGKVWPLDPSLVTGLSKTSLAASTCQTLPTGDHWINGALFVKSSTASATYYVTATGEKRQVTGRVSMGALSYPYWPEVLQVTSPYLSSLPTAAPIVPYFGKQPPTGPVAASSSFTAPDVSSEQTSLRTTEQRVTCYTDYVQALGVSMFAPLAQIGPLDDGCLRELGIASVTAG